MNKPDISPNFTVDDILVICEFNWEQTKDLSENVQVKDIVKGKSFVVIYTK